MNARKALLTYRRRHKVMIKKVIRDILGQSKVIDLQTRKKFHKVSYLQELLKQNEQFKDKYKGKRCFVLGNGPSLKKIDFKLLENEFTFTVNQLPRNDRFSQLKTNVHLWSDWRFFDLHRDNEEEMELLNVMKAVNTENNRPLVFYKMEAYNMIQKFELDKYLDIFYYDEVLPVEVLPKYIDFTKLVPQFRTVVHYAISLAVYMGFSEIYLLGCDCSGFISNAETKLGSAEKSLYGYNVSENEKKRMEKVAEKMSLRDELQLYVNLFDDYEKMKAYCQSYGVKLYNATGTTLLESVPRVEFDTIIKHKCGENIE